MTIEQQKDTPSLLGKLTEFIQMVSFCVTVTFAVMVMVTSQSDLLNLSISLISLAVFIGVTVLHNRSVS